MAIIIGEKHNRVNWFAIAIALFILVFIGSLIYFLFVAPSPLIEKIAPIELKDVNDISNTNIQPGDILQNQAFVSLKKYVPDPDIGNIGRANPFLPL